jgi:hypothetical protein
MELFEKRNSLEYLPVHIKKLSNLKTKKVGPLAAVKEKTSGMPER